MNSQQDAQLRAIHSAVVAQNGQINALVASIRADLDAARRIVQEQIRRNIGGIQYTKTQKQDNEDTNTIARLTLNGDSSYEGLIGTQQELESRGYQIGQPDVINYDAIGDIVRRELNKTYLFG